jgi:hypothetical protein
MVVAAGQAGWSFSPASRRQQPTSAADRAGQRVTSVPDITRLLARGKPGGRAEAARRLAEANKLLDEVSNMLGDVRRELLGRR